MNPIRLSQQLQDTLTGYLTSTFDVNRDGQEPALAAFMKESFSQPQALFTGPYLELTPPYKTDKTLEELAAAGVISKELLQMECFQQNKPLPVNAPLYTHQATAIHKLCAENRNIVVSSGTGSGKTECFLLPILNDLLVDPTPGVRAIIIYPLNALVNDQLDRLRELLRGTNITFGRYTSELEEKSKNAREQMKKEWQEMDPARKALFNQYPLPNEIIGRDQIQEQGLLPQILITNYAMLEYLLLRPQDSPLFDQGRWRFIVLDEAHTYAGAQGIEVGLLMRRLKLRLNKQSGETQCIATSATLTNDDANDAAKFAKALFGEDFTQEDIIFGEINHDYVAAVQSTHTHVTAYIDKRFEALIENVRQEQWESTDDMALLMQEIGLINEEQLTLAEIYPPPQFLWQVMHNNEDLIQLRKLMAARGQPAAVATIAEELFQNRLPADKQQDALYHLIELAAMARQNADKPSLLPARYHLFVRPPQGIWACLNPTCEAKHEGNQWSKLFATPRETCDTCGLPVYPLVVCRTCGQVYIRMQKVGREYLPEAAMEDEADKHYLTWRLINENRALAEQDEDEDILVEQAGESMLKQKELRICLQCKQEVRANGKCACLNKSENSVLLYLLKKEKAVKRGNTLGSTEEIVNTINECGRCHGRALKDTEVATEISMNALTPLAVLTDDLYRSLPESAQPDIRNKAGNGRKLLSFYDSRQGAARFAAFVQDIVNQQAYRRIIREAIATASTDSFWPDMEQISEICLEYALRYRIAHNDPNISEGDLPRDSQYLNQSQRKRIKSHLSKQVFAEVTTQLRSRQSLEALGLIAVQYFEPDQKIDFSPLASKLKLSQVEVRALLEYLLDDLRRGKVVTLPDGIKRDDPIFGRNKFSPRVVRGQDANEYEIAWIGKTTRHRRRQLVEKILRHKGLNHDEASVIRALEIILDWLIDQSSVLDTSRPAIGFQIRHDRLFFQASAQWYRCDQCQRLNCRGNSLPCPHPHCQGTLHPVEIDRYNRENFFYNNLRQQLIPMRIEEHTAQLDPDKGRNYQNQFKSGNINMLSCSTTFEMGIDLGDLQAVVMSNIPPTVANYKQRAGRAGRRSSGTAFIMVWASNRPHDQTYFKTPAEIIGGRVRIPFLDVHNHIIIQRHINAILLSKFLLYCASIDRTDRQIGALFDEQTPGGSYYQMLPQWLNDHQEDLLQLLDNYALAVDKALDSQQILHMFEYDMLEKAYNFYQNVAGYYKEVLQEKGNEQMKLITSGGKHQDISTIGEEIRRYSRLLERLRNEDIINHLSDRGVLPSYSFPLHVVELRIPPHLLPEKQLRLQRNLQQAIREYAPGQEVVADKRIWKSEALDFFGKEPQIFAYRICPNCNYLHLEQTAGKELEQTDQPCPICYEKPKRGKWAQYHYIQPDGFRVSNDSGQPAGQYVDRPYNLMRSALVPRPVETITYSQSLAIGYDREGKLLYVNEGEHGHGFRICPICGKQVRKGNNKCDGKWNGQPCTGKLDLNSTFTLGFKQETDTLHLKFTSTSHINLPQPSDPSFWPSLKYALLQGASHALQIERKDIDGVLFPEPPESFAQQWRQSIVLYDSVPGGAGHVKQIRDEIVQVVAAALEIVNCDCERSCYRCLREYGNQWEHHLLDRRPVVDFLRALHADLQNEQVNGLDMHPVAAVNPTVWLWEQLQHAKQQLYLAAEKLTLEYPTVEGETWLDRLQQVLQRGVRINLYLNQLPDQTSGGGEAIIIATHLRLLLRKGLNLYQTDQALKWLAVIDPDTPSPTAILSPKEPVVVLGCIVATQLEQTNDSNAVTEIKQRIAQAPAHVISDSDLREPADTIVREVIPDGKTHSEVEYFLDFYTKKPVSNMVISDRYLNTKEKILGRLAAHIHLAKQNGKLEWIVVKTQQFDDEQKRAIQQLKSQFPDIRIRFELNRQIEHDRYIEVTYADNNKARVIIGVGLDFIEPNGYVRKTFRLYM